MSKRQKAPQSAWKNRIVGTGLVDAAELLANPRNWRLHPDNQREALDKVLGTVGWVQNVIVNRRTGFVVDGHLRADLAISKGEKVPVQYVDLAPEEESLILATFDRLTAMAGVDSEKLSELVEEAAEAFPDIQEILTGIDDLIEPEEPGGGLTDDDATPEVPASPVTTLGDCWRLGAHRLVCGDSTKESDVQRCLNGVQPHLMVTDPPYGVEYDANWRNEADRSNGKPRSRHRAIGKVQNDDKADWREAWKLFPGDVAYVWHAGIYAGTVAESLVACGLDIRAQIIWAKTRFAISRGHYHWQHEPCWYAVRNKGHWTGDRSQTTLWTIDHQKSETGHSTQKPVECMRRPILNNSSPGQAVYEPFAGSGTTIIAAESTGRICHAIELEPAYCDVIVKRWQEYTGEQAVLDGDGRTFDEIATDRHREAA